MRRIYFTVIGIFVLLSIFSTMAFADNQVKLFVNSKEIKPDVSPQIINGRVLVPIRWVAEALEADVKWDEKNQKVLINSSLQKQIELLHNALAPRTPKNAAELWAKGVKERNGALQYAMLSPELKKEEYSTYENNNWITGVSSPWVEDYKITNESKAKDGTWTYTIEFSLKASTGFAGKQFNQIDVKQYEQYWYITKIYNQ